MAKEEPFWHWAETTEEIIVSISPDNILMAFSSVLKRMHSRIGIGLLELITEECALTCFNKA
jgi:hypothetical protein